MSDLSRRLEERPIYPRPATVRLALSAIHHPNADLDGRARLGTAAHDRWRRRVDQIETVLEFVSRVPVGRAY